MISAWGRLAFALVCALTWAACTTPHTSGPTTPVVPSQSVGNTGPKVERRPHHYLFAHRILPQFFFRDTDSLCLALREDPDGVLGGMWTSLGEVLQESDRLPGDGLSGEWRETDDGLRMCIITFPKAEIMPEALFAVLAIRGKKRWYLTYERSLMLDALQEEHAILCAWTSDGTHLNYGFGGDHSRAAFEKALQLFFKNNPDPAAETSVGQSVQSEDAAETTI